MEQTESIASSRIPSTTSSIQSSISIRTGIGSVTLVQTKQGSLALRQGGFDSNPLSMQFVQVTVERIFGQKGKSICKISASAVERIQSGMANSLGGVNQPVESHDTGQLPYALAEVGLSENAVQTQTQPKLIADMDGASLARFFGAHLVDMHGQQAGVCGSPMSRLLH